MTELTYHIKISIYRIHQGLCDVELIADKIWKPSGWQLTLILSDFSNVFINIWHYSQKVTTQLWNYINLFLQSSIFLLKYICIFLFYSILDEYCYLGQVVLHVESDKNVMIYSPSCRSKPIRPSSSLEHKLRYFWWNPRAFWPCIDSNATKTFKVQRGSKDIVKIVHVTTVVQP